jgi:hypothetical protein
MTDLNLDQFTGTEHYYKHFTGLLYTDGILYLINKTNCHWFIDVIASYQYKFKDVHFQIWKFEKKEVNDLIDAVVTMREDTNKPVRISQDIFYTDFPLDEIEVYCINNVVLLKSEY